MFTGFAVSTIIDIVNDKFDRLEWSSVRVLLYSPYSPFQIGIFSLLIFFIVCSYYLFSFVFLFILKWFVFILILSDFY